MSAIFGIINLDGRPVDPGAMERMRMTLSHRGPDGSSVWAAGPVALGHHMMRITPESCHETVPCGNAAEDVYIAATTRLDNRADLFHAFDVPSAEQTGMPDSRLILKAYERWKDACPAYLAGDFAFAIWDAREKRLVCASDPMGVCPIYYVFTPQRVVFASEIKGILALPDIPVRLNERKVASLAVPVATYMDTESTFYENVRRLPKATVMTIDAGGMRKRISGNLRRLKGSD